MKTPKKLLLALALLAGSTGVQAAELNLFGWSEYVPQDVLDGFTKETGITVNFETYASNEEMLSKLVAGGGNYDLVQPSEYAAELMIRRNMLAKLDKAKLPNFKNLSPEFLGQVHDPKDEYTVPYMSGTVGIVVNTAVVKDDIKGYKDVFQAKFKNRLVVLDDNREIVTWALYASGLPVNEINPTSLAKVRPLVSEWVKLVKVFDSGSPKTALLNGDVDIGIVWSGEAALLWKEDQKFKYVLPAEGAHRFIDIFAIPADAPHKDAAHAFINYILKPEVSKIVSENFPYTNPNLEARKLLTPEEQANPASYPTGSPKLETFRDIGKAAAEIDQLMTDLKSAQ
ncbi:Spermidine/putrescine-binding periplasmic protein precursor [Lacunisphaera limnophila]|uniref:Spermidine/putrescine-binding periplasmic protein n=1 Tax=Lacunisphaera limnophila TaxID=1838286 RepID=A0A1D8AZ97_9BACT|nr:spermidine/putrescine ABC transporter substrate-binding protein [Lacunisphaera limnophila]AOS46222.1 Spermidine/putrescine-binding periplasmic protein precursor [Lacunisphaera limnophila]